MPHGTRIKLVALLSEGCLLQVSSDALATPHPAHQQFANACFRGLFALCMSGEDDLGIAQIAAPLLIDRCAHVLRQFVIDDRATGQLPLPRARLEEVHFVLSELRKLEMPRTVFTGRSQAKLMDYGGQRQHLVELYPLLVDCITAREDHIKEPLGAVLQVLGREVGLE